MSTTQFMLPAHIACSAAPGVSVEAAVASVPFQQWYYRLDPRFDLRGLHFASVDAFGGRVRFIKFTADCYDQQGRKIPGIMFMRGGSVAMLPIFVCGKRYYTALTVQARLPTGRLDFIEVPAGTMDSNGNFAGDAAREIQEELHITVHESELIDMSALAGNEGAFVSPGGTDETLRYFAFVRRVEKDWLAKVNGRQTGLAEENEQITLKIVPLNTLWRYPDGKTVQAYCYFRELKDRGLLKLAS